MLDRLLFMFCITCLLGMSQPPSYRYDPFFNTETDTKIKEQCIQVSKNTATAVQDCITSFSAFTHYSMVNSK